MAEDGLGSKPDTSHCVGMGASCLIINPRVTGQGGQKVEARGKEGRTIELVTWGCCFLNWKRESRNQPGGAGQEAGMGETSWAEAGAANEGSDPRQRNLRSWSPSLEEQLASMQIIHPLFFSSEHWSPVWLIALTSPWSEQCLLLKLSLSGFIRLVELTWSSLVYPQGSQLICGQLRLLQRGLVGGVLGPGVPESVVY